MNPTRRRRREPPGALTAVRFGALAPPRPGNQDSQSVRGPERHSGPRTVFPAGRTQPSRVRNRHGFQPTHSRLSRDSSRGTPRIPSSPLWRATYTHIIVLTTFPRDKGRSLLPPGRNQATQRQRRQTKALFSSASQPREASQGQKGRSVE